MGLGSIIHTARLQTFLLLASPMSAHAERRLSANEAIALAKATRPEVKLAESLERLATVNRLEALFQWFKTDVRTELTKTLTAHQTESLNEVCEVLGTCQSSQTSRLFLARADLRVPIWSGLRNEAGLVRASHEAAASRHAFADTSRRVAFEAASAYWRVKRADRLLAAFEKGHQRAVEFERVTHARVGAGVAPAVENELMQTRQLQRSAVLCSLRGKVEESRAALAQALSIEGDIVLADDFPLESVEVPSLKASLERARADRPDMKEAVALLEARRAEVLAIQSDYWPQLNLFLTGELGNRVPGDYQERLAGTFAGGIHLSWSLFNSFTTTLEAKRSALRAQAMRYELQRRAQSTTTEVRNAIAMLRTAKEERRFLEDALGHAVATAMLLRRRYQAGAAMLIEVTQADDVVLGLEISLVENAASIALADVSFKAAIGAI